MASLLQVEQTFQRREGVIDDQMLVPWTSKMRSKNWPLDLAVLRTAFGEGNGNPLQCSRLENPRDGGAWWAAVCGVTQGRTRLKRLSSIRTAFTLVTASAEMEKISKSKGEGKLKKSSSGDNFRKFSCKRNQRERSEGRETDQTKFFFPNMRKITAYLYVNRKDLLQIDAFE